MKQLVISAALILVGMAGGTALAAHAAPPPAPKPSPKEPEAVEYKFFVLASSDAPTGEHEKQLNALGAQGWHVVAPIYSGGILNSYLMQRVHAEK
jgi:hypothetical protein